MPLIWYIEKEWDYHCVDCLCQSHSWLFVPDSSTGSSLGETGDGDLATNLAWALSSDSVLLAGASIEVAAVYDPMVTSIGSMLLPASFWSCVCYLLGP